MKTRMFGITPAFAPAALAACVVLLAAEAGAAERRAIVYRVPAGAESATVEGSLSFPPGAVAGPENLGLSAGERVVPSAIVERSAWFDGSLMLVKVRFEGSRENERRVWVEWGGDVKAVHKPAGEFASPAVEFRVFDAASDIRVEGDVNVGTMVVRVEQHAGIYYYWYLLPIALILGFLVWRKSRLRGR